jgi:Holliday junction resolvase RusA-like endonuclease
MKIREGVAEVIQFTVYGEPKAQGRPRAAVINGRAIMYDPKPSRDFKRDVKAVAQDYVPDKLLAGPLVLELKIYRPIPKSFSKKKREQALSGELRPTTKPDLKNYIAGIEDALEKVIYENDSQIVSYGDSGKWYGDPPRIEVAIKGAV